MAITTGAAVQEFDVRSAVVNVSGLPADSISVQVDASALVLDDNVSFASAVLDVEVAGLFETGKYIHLYRRDLDILENGNHAPIPGVNYKSIFIGSFLLDATALRQYVSLPNVPISNNAEYYIHNDCGFALSGNTIVYITPWTWNGKA